MHHTHNFTSISNHIVKHQAAFHHWNLLYMYKYNGKQILQWNKNIQFSFLMESNCSKLYFWYQNFMIRATLNELKCTERWSLDCDDFSLLHWSSCRPTMESTSTTLCLVLRDWQSFWWLDCNQLVRAHFREHPKCSNFKFACIFYVLTNGSENPKNWIVSVSMV